MILQWGVTEDPFMGYGQLFDVNGREIELDVIWADTETGKVVFCPRDEKNRFMFDDGGTNIKREERTFPPPLLFVPFDSETDVPPAVRGQA